MSVNLAQMLATAGVGTGIAASVAIVYAPIARRREQRKLDALAAAATAQSIAMQSVVTAAVAAVKEDMIKRVDESDRATAEKLNVVATSVTVVAERQRVAELNLATQFGGNGGGIRQAINEQSAALGHLAGVVEQHIREGDK